MQRIAPSTLRKMLLVPLVAGILASIVIRTTHLDPNFSGRFFDAGTGTWAGNDAAVATFVYDYGTLPGIFLGVGGLVWAVSGLARRPRSPDPRGLYLGLCLIVGPGLVVNTTFKDNFGRPRPRDTVNFGGEHAFHPVGTPGADRSCKSFPSGHASMGFLLGVPALLAGTRRKFWFRAWVVLGISAGIGIGLVRIAQGGHWLSDVLWSGLFVYFTAIGIGFATGLLKPGTEPFRTFSHPRYSRLPGRPPSSDRRTSR